MTMYALYRGDEFVMMGTSYQLAAKMGVKVDTVHWLATPTAKKRAAAAKRKCGRFYVERVGDAE